MAAAAEEPKRVRRSIDDIIGALIGQERLKLGCTFGGRPIDWEGCWRELCDEVVAAGGGTIQDVPVGADIKVLPTTPVDKWTLDDWIVVFTMQHFRDQ